MNMILNFQSLSDVQEQIDLEKTKVLKIFPQAQKKSPKAFEQFYIARKALIKCFKDKGINASFKQLDIVNHHYVFPIPGNLVSLSHSEDLGLAILASDKEVRSVGVDFEKVGRKVPEGSERFFKNENDKHSNASPIDIWVIKEACFKCLHPLWKRLHLNPQMVLHHISIDNGQFIVTAKNGELVQGSYTLNEMEYQGQNLIVAQAWLPL
jgi:phosphopantetheinyl transferase (holo-ACP synthase)